MGVFCKSLNFCLRVCALGIVKKVGSMLVFRSVGTMMVAPGRAESRKKSLKPERSLQRQQLSLSMKGPAFGPMTPDTAFQNGGTLQ